MDLNKLELSPLQIGLVTLGLAAWSIAGLILGNSSDSNQVDRPATWNGQVAAPPAVAVAPNNKAGLGALGFAIAGGLCFMGAAIANRADKLARDSVSLAEPGAADVTMNVKPRLGDDGR
jgi:hypothetical protein